MTSSIKALRRANLAVMIKDVSAGNQAAFSEMIGKSTSQISDMLRGEKSFGEKVARDIELLVGYPAHWLDQVHNSQEAVSAIFTDRLGTALMLLGCDDSTKSHHRHNLVAAIALFAGVSGNEELEVACDTEMSKIRALEASGDRSHERGWHSNIRGPEYYK